MLILGLDASLARCSAAILAGRCGACGGVRGGRPWLRHPACPPWRATCCAPPGCGRGARRRGGDGRAGQLHRAARRAGAGARHRAGGRAAGGVRVTELGRVAAPRRCRALTGGPRRAVGGASTAAAAGCSCTVATAAFESVALDALPRPTGPVAVAGDAAFEVAARLAARGADVMLTDARLPLARHVAAVGGAAPGAAGWRRCRRSRSMSIRPRRACRPAACARRRRRYDRRYVRPVIVARAPGRTPRRWRRCMPPPCRTDEAWSAAAIAAQLALPGTFGLIDPAGGMVLARVAADEAEILALAVAPPARRQGRGAALLAGRRGAGGGGRGADDVSGSGRPNQPAARAVCQRRLCPGRAAPAPITATAATRWCCATPHQPRRSSRRVTPSAPSSCDST